MAFCDLEMRHRRVLLDVKLTFDKLIYYIIIIIIYYYTNMFNRNQ